MAILKRLKSLRQDENTGYSSSANNSGRFFDRKKNTANVRKTGISWLNHQSWYHTMLEMKRGKFLGLLFLIYITINIVFAAVYYVIGIEHLAGIEDPHGLKGFSEVFFFSTQTFTTVGYGRISPTGFLTSAVATFEAFLGLLSFAIATGLFYGRFSRPQAFIRYSHHALIAPYKDGSAVMFRLVPFKNNKLSDVEVKLTLAMDVEENGRIVNKFYTLKTEISQINSLPLNWTIVHAIDEESPFQGITKTELSQTDLELMVYVRAFDDVFSNTVVSRWSYMPDEFIWGAKFEPMYFPGKNNDSTVLDISRLNLYKEAVLPENPALPD